MKYTESELRLRLSCQYRDANYNILGSGRWWSEASLPLREKGLAPMQFTRSVKIELLNPQGEVIDVEVADSQTHAERVLKGRYELDWSKVAYTEETCGMRRHRILQSKKPHR